MTDEISSLLGFSKQREALRLGYGRVEEVIERAIQSVKVLPEFESIAITFSHEGEGFGWFDAGKLERVILNLSSTLPRPFRPIRGESRWPAGCRSGPSRFELPTMVLES